LVALAAFYLLPIYVLVNNGLKSFQEVSLSRMWEPPSRVGLDSFARAYERLAPNFRNSVLLVVPATLVTAALGSINGYLLAKWKFTGADVVFPLLLFGMFIPYQSVLIPLVQTLQWLGRTLG
ncbi:MAG: carbohydrate ABC transporter permease, partial [Armatimonadota bacterium]|nr:carbohydrate ABC transporter permease [Armatimonadota bacterium]